MPQNTKLPSTKQAQVSSTETKLEEVSIEDLKKIQEKRHIIIRC